MLGIDSSYIKGEDNNCTDNISHIAKDNISSIFSLFQTYPK